MKKFFILFIVLVPISMVFLLLNSQRELISINQVDISTQPKAIEPPSKHTHEIVTAIESNQPNLENRLNSDQFTKEVLTNYQEYCGDLHKLRQKLENATTEFKDLTERMARNPSVELMALAHKASREVSKFRGSLILCLNDKIKKEKEIEKQKD